MRHWEPDESACLNQTQPIRSSVYNTNTLILLISTGKCSLLFAIKFWLLTIFIDFPIINWMITGNNLTVIVFFLYCNIDHFCLIFGFSNFPLNLEFHFCDSEPPHPFECTWPEAATSGIFAAFSDVTSPLHRIKKGWVRPDGVSLRWEGSLELWPTARTPNIEPPWLRASRISPCAGMLEIIVMCVFVSVSRTMESSSSRGCWTSTGVSVAQSDFKCMMTTKDSVSTGTTTRCLYALNQQICLQGFSHNRTESQTPASPPCIM